MWQIETVAVSCPFISARKLCFCSCEIGHVSEVPEHSVTRAMNCTITPPVGTPRCYLIHRSVFLSGHLHQPGNLPRTCRERWSLELGARVKERVRLTAEEWEHQNDCLVN